MTDAVMRIRILLNCQGLICDEVRGQWNRDVPTWARASDMVLRSNNSTRPAVSRTGQDIIWGSSQHLTTGSCVFYSAKTRHET